MKPFSAKSPSCAIICSIIALFIIFASCKKLPQPEQLKQNSAPISNAGADQTILLPDFSLQLDGSSSSDPDNNIVSYSWRKISGPFSFTIANSNTVKTQVTNLEKGIYEFEFKVTDAGGLFDIDTVAIKVVINKPSEPVDCGNYWVCVNAPSFSAHYGSAGEFYQSYGASVSLEGKVYFAGGIDDFWNYGGSLDGGMEYDPVKFSTRSFVLSVPRSFLAGATAGNKILFTGGNQMSGYTDNPDYNTVDIYDNQTLARTVATLSEARSHLASASLGNQAFFIGGKTKGGFSAKMDIYNSVSNSWQVVTIPHARGFAGAAVIGNKIYIAGGQNSNGNIRTVDIYEIQSGQWSSIDAPNDHPFSSVVSINDKLIVAGGDGVSNKSADIYNTTTGQWSTVNLINSRFKMTVATIKNKAVFLGGANLFSGQYFLNESGGIDIYDDVTGNWKAGSVSPGVCGMMAASVGSQIIYVGFMWDNGNTNSIANTMITLSGD